MLSLFSDEVSMVLHKETASFLAVRQARRDSDGSNSSETAVLSTPLPLGWLGSSRP